MLGLGTRLRTGRLTLGLRLGGLPPVVVPGNTLNNTFINSQLDHRTVQGFDDASIGYAPLRDALIAKGKSPQAFGSRSVVDIVTELDQLSDPEPQPSISFVTPTADVTEGGTVSNTLTLGRDGLTGPIVVNLATSGTATSGTDYTALPATITIADGASAVSFDLTTIDDSGVESGETIVITATLADYPDVTATKTITIQDNDDAQPSPGLTQHGTTARVAPRDVGQIAMVVEWDADDDPYMAVHGAAIIRGKDQTTYPLFQIDPVMRRWTAYRFENGTRNGGFGQAVGEHLTRPYRCRCETFADQSFVASVNDEPIVSWTMTDFNNVWGGISGTLVGYESLDNPNDPATNVVTGTR